jgi:hypothetical protein
MRLHGERRMVGLGDATTVPVDQAKVKVLREWDRWIGRQPGVEHPAGRDGFQFFLDLQSKRSSALDFDAGSIDRWLIVHNWLIAAGKVSD